MLHPFQFCIGIKTTENDEQSLQANSTFSKNRMGLNANPKP